VIITTEEIGGCVVVGVLKLGVYKRENRLSSAEHWKGSSSKKPVADVIAEQKKAD